MTEAVFGIGEPVARVGGDYRFDGWIVGHVWKRSGALRYAVEDDRGVLHIFNERQICRRQEIDAKLKGGARHNEPGGSGPFKVGDRVRVVRCPAYLSGAQGKEAKIVEKDGEHRYHLVFDEPIRDRSGPMGSYSHYVPASMIEHLDPAQPAQDAVPADACPYCEGAGRLQGGPSWSKCPRCYGSGKAEDVEPRNAVEASAVPAAGEAERLEKAADYLEYLDVGTADRHAAAVRETATLLARQAELIRTLVGALEPVANQINDSSPLGIYAFKAAEVLDAARAMGFGKEGE